MKFFITDQLSEITNLFYKSKTCGILTPNLAEVKPLDDTELIECNILKERDHISGTHYAKI